jgi:hypothetical protein
MIVFFIARRSLEAALESLQCPGADSAQKILHRGVATGIAELSNLAQQSASPCGTRTSRRARGDGIVLMDNNRKV